MQPISSLARTLTIAAICATLLVAALAAFSAGTITHLYRASAGPGAAPAEVVAALSTIERELGRGGYLQAHRQFRTTGEAAASAVAAQHAQAAQAALARLDAFAPAQLAALRASVAEFAAAAAGTTDMDGAFLSLQNEAARLRQLALLQKLDALAVMSERAIWAIGAAVVTLALGLGFAAAFLSSGVAAPLRQLYASLATISRGAGADPIWGVDRKDEIGAVARAADRLRQAIAEAPGLSALGSGQTVRIRMDGPAGLVFEKIMGDLAAAVRQLDGAAQTAQAQGGAGREQLTAASQRLAAVAAELSGLTNGARAEIKDAADGMRQAASSVTASGQHVQAHLSHVTQRFGATGDHMAAAAAEVSGRVTMALAELAAAAEGLRGAAQEARANQSAVTQFTNNASTQTAEALGLLHSAGFNLNSALTSLEDRIARALQSVSRLSEHLSASASTLSGAAKDMEGRTRESETRLGLALDELRQAPGATLTQLSAAVQELQALLMHKTGAAGDHAPDSLEFPAMPPLRSLRSPVNAKMPLAAADMLARLGSIAAEVRAAAGHESATMRETAGETPVSVPDAIDAAAHDIQYLSDMIADLENRAASIADDAAQTAPDLPDEDARARADARADEAIVAVMQSIERLNNIAAALSRAGDFHRMRKAGE